MTGYSLNQDIMSGNISTQLLDYYRKDTNGAIMMTNVEKNTKTRMAISRVHTSTEAADPSKLLLLNAG